MRPKTKAGLTVPILVFVFGLFDGAPVMAADTLTLKNAGGVNFLSVPLLHDMKGKAYLPLTEVAGFYGVQIQFDSQTRKVTLSKDKIHANLVLSQPLFMATDPDLSVPIDPVEMITGQLGIPPSSAEDVFGTLLDAQVSYLPDQQTLSAGGVRDEELSPDSQAVQPPLPTAVPANPAAVGATQVPAPTAVPSPEPAAEKAPEIKTTFKHRNLLEEPSSDKRMKARRIVIDAGHGGTDAGAPGRDRRYVEKQATLDIAKKVAVYLKEEDPQLEVLLTRDADYYITLKYRTDFAKAHDADLFVSIHCNSNPREAAHGTEIYRYGTRASNQWAALEAERENGREKDGGDSVLAEVKNEVNKIYSQKLAEVVEKKIDYRLGQHFRNIQDAPFYVLAHAEMPAILVETAFISNQKEENKLRDPYWKDNMAKAIAEGILGYKEALEGNDENEQARR